MKPETLVTTVYVCEYCGLKLSNRSAMEYHESICPHNPANQPCSKCNNCLVNPFTGTARCGKNMDMDSVGGNVLCFCYRKGEPQMDLQLPEATPEEPTDDSDN